MQVYSENLYSNENNYSEPFETVNNYSETVNNYRRAQSPGKSTHSIYVKFIFCIARTWSIGKK